MKRNIASALRLMGIGVLMLVGTGVHQEASGAEARPMASVTALAHVNPVYHQIAAIFVESPGNVNASGIAADSI